MWNLTKLATLLPHMVRVFESNTIFLSVSHAISNISTESGDFVMACHQQVYKFSFGYKKNDNNSHFFNIIYTFLIGYNTDFALVKKKKNKNGPRQAKKCLQTCAQIRRHIHIIFFVFLDKNIHCGYSLEAPRQGASNEYPQRMFLSRNKKDISIFRMKKASSNMCKML